MTIGKNAEYILEHPFMRKAVLDFAAGDVLAMKQVLVTIQEDMYHRMLGSCVRSYKRAQGENSPVIVEEIRNTPPPDTLRAALPVPECLVVTLKVG